MIFPFAIDKIKRGVINYHIGRRIGIPPDLRTGGNCPDALRDKRLELPGIFSIVVSFIFHERLFEQGKILITCGIALLNLLVPLALKTSMDDHCRYRDEYQKRDNDYDFGAASGYLAVVLY